MKTLKTLLLQLIACLIITSFSFGQDILTLYNGGRINIKSGTVFQSTDLNIGVGSQLSNRGNLTVNGVLANFAGSPGLILQADETGYGSLMHSTNLAPASIEQYLSSERWHLITPPVQQATIGIVENLYLKQWHENTAAWEYLVLPLSMPMNITQGYSVWAAEELTGPKTVVLEGNTCAGNIGVTGLSYTVGTGQEGWNLVGNPYPSPVEWNTDWTLTSVGGWAIVYENGTFKGWNPWLPEGEQSYNGKADGFIAPSQGFWIRATDSSPYITIPQSARAHNSVDFLKDELVSDELSLHITVSANGFTDETVILFMEDAETGFDPLYDLEKHMNVAESPNIYSIPQNDKKYAINVLPKDWIANSIPAVIPLGYIIEPNSNCELTAIGVEKFDFSQSIFLEDIKEGTLQNLSYNNVYAFAAHGEDDPNRFLLHFGQTASTEENLSFNWRIYAYGHHAYIQKPLDRTAIAQIYDLSGKLYKTVKLSNVLTKIWIEQGGHYVVKIINNDFVKAQKIYINY